MILGLGSSKVHNSHRGKIIKQWTHIIDCHFLQGVQIILVVLSRGGVTLCAPRARARAVFGPDKCKDLCGHGQFLLRKLKVLNYN